MRKNEARWIEGRKRWQINVQSEGERKTFVDSTLGVKGKVACEKKADKWLEDKLAGENARVDTMLDRYAASLKKATSTAHYNQYSSHIKNYIRPKIGFKKIGKVTNADLQGIVDNAYSKADLSRKSLANIRGCIVSFMTFCIDSNATNIRLKKFRIPAGAKRSCKQILTPAELQKLFSSEDTTWNGKQCKDFYIHAYRFLVLTGLRPGELIGLTKDSIRGNTIRVTKAINDLNETTQGKNKNAVRVIKIGPTAQAVLQDQANMLKKYGGISKFVFPNKYMEHIDQEDFRRSWKRYCIKNKFENIIAPYELRHTFVSINDEMPESLKKPYVGHSPSMDTEGIYGHAKQGDLDRAADYIEGNFKKIIGTH